MFETQYTTLFAFQGEGGGEVVVDPTTFQPVLVGTVNFRAPLEALKQLDELMGRADISSETELFEHIGRSFMTALAKRRLEDVERQKNPPEPVDAAGP